MKTKIKRLAPQPEPATMRKNEVCRYLGVSYAGLNRLIKDAGFPCRRVGTFYFFSRAEVDKWLAERN